MCLIPRSFKGLLAPTRVHLLGVCRKGRSPSSASTPGQFLHVSLLFLFLRKDLEKREGLETAQPRCS